MMHIERIGRLTATEMAALLYREAAPATPVCCFDCREPLQSGRVIRGVLRCEPCAASIGRVDLAQRRRTLARWPR